MFKELVLKELIFYVFVILLDLEYGLFVVKVCDIEVGLLFVYEKMGYDVIILGWLFDLLVDWFVLCLKEEGVDVIKFLLYYDVDEDLEINY